MNAFLKAVRTPGFRKWLYGVLLAVLLFLGGEGIISAAQQENIGAIVQAVLQTAPAAGFALAIRKTTLTPSDRKVDGELDEDGVPVPDADDDPGEWPDWDEEKAIESLITTDVEIDPTVVPEDPTDPAVRARHGVL